MRQTKPFPESERVEQLLVKVDEKQQSNKSRKGDSQSAEDRTSLERIPNTNQSLVLQSNRLYEEPSSEGFISLLRDWWRLIYRHKLLVISVIVGILPFVIIMTYRQKPIYQATAIIEVRAEGSSLKPNDIFSTNVYDNTKAEVFIIKSRPVIERTVVNLNLDRYPSFLKVNNERSIWE